MQQGLLVIDVQNDYFAGGKMELALPNAALEKINQLEDYFLKQKLPIIYIQHIKHQKPADFFEAGSIGAELHPRLKTQANSIVIEKHFPDSFYQTDLETIVKQQGVEQLVICGMMTHMCITETTKAAQERELHPILISDATATKSLMIDGEYKAAEKVQKDSLAKLADFAKHQTTSTFLN